MKGHNIDPRDYLGEVLNRGESVTIVYHGGSQPGAKRRITPIEVKGNRVRAFDGSTNIAKMFSIDKLEIVDDEHPAQNYSPQKTISNQTRDVAQVFEDDVDSLKALGWEVSLTTEAIKLYKRGPDGLPESTATVGLRRNYDQALVISLEGSRGETVESEKPWYVFGPDLIVGFIDPEPEEGRAYKYLSKAKETFLNQAKLYAPNDKR